MEPPVPLMTSRTPLAATCTERAAEGLWDVQFQIYFQGGRQGTISATDARGGPSTVALWYGSSPNNTYQVLTWNLDQDGFLFYVDIMGNIMEYIKKEGQWGRSQVIGGTKFKAARYSQLGAITWEDDVRKTRLYYQDYETDDICELVKNGDADWVAGSRHSGALKGSNIATNTNNDPHTGKITKLKLYFQQQDSTIAEYIYTVSEGEWKKGNFWTYLSINLGASISVAGDYLFLVTGNNTLGVVPWNEEKGVWDNAYELFSVIPFGPVTAIWHARPYYGDYNITFFCQKSADEITRVGFTSKDEFKVFDPIIPEPAKDVPPPTQ